MLLVDKDENGVYIFMVCNEQGNCLIRTSSSRIAQFVNYHSKGINSKLRLTVGGDPGTKTGPIPIFHHIRHYRR